jgi:hypothetical protein
MIKKDGSVYKADLSKRSDDINRIGEYIGKIIKGKLNTLINE